MGAGSDTQLLKTRFMTTESLHTASQAPAIGSGDQSLEVTLGKRVRALRRRVDLTAVDLAAQAQVSVATVSKIENGLISTSLSTLDALARALKVSIAELFADLEDRRDCSMVPAGQGVVIDRRGTRAGHHYRLLGHALRGPVVTEPYLVSLSSEAETFDQFRHAGIEFIHMLEGSVLYRHGDNSYQLSPGDSMLFDAAALHGPQQLLELPARFLSVIMYSRDE
ncbi:MAG: transcriptional regulator with XRE-family HTH domain [Gammaproteobacteria bacterium]|jgi:transcriptional regulator with XRE-family HTH domain